MVVPCLAMDMVFLVVMVGSSALDCGAWTLCKLLEGRGRQHSPSSRRLCSGAVALCLPGAPHAGCASQPERLGCSAAAVILLQAKAAQAELEECLARKVKQQLRDFVRMRIDEAERQAQQRTAEAPASLVALVGLSVSAFPSPSPPHPARKRLLPGIASWSMVTDEVQPALATQVSCATSQSISMLQCCIDTPAV